MYFSNSINPQSYRKFLEQAAQVDIFQDPDWAVVSADSVRSGTVILGVIDDPELPSAEDSGDFDKGEIIIAALCYINHSKYFGNYLYIQHGPILRQQNTPANVTPEQWGRQGSLDSTNPYTQEALKHFLSGLQKYCQQLGYFALVIEPLAEKDSLIGTILSAAGFETQTRSLLPRHPLYLNLQKSSEELLAQLSKNTRYYINYARKQGVEIEFFYPQAHDIKAGQEYLDKFHELLLEISSHKGYGVPAKAFFQGAWDTYAGSGKILFALAKHEGKVVSANFTQLYNNWAGSYYTANSRHYSKLHASYLLKWETILETQRQGKRIFDMWGYIPNLPSNHSEFGYGQFKLGFNPLAKELCGRMVLPIDRPKYIIWKLFRELRYRLGR